MSLKPKKNKSHSSSQGKGNTPKPTWRVNHETQRIEVIYPSKPDYDERYKLKSKGFRWSPTRGAWVRKINPQSMYKAQSLGFEKTHDIGTSISGAEKAEREVQRMEKSVKRHEAKSSRAGAERIALHEEAKKMGEIIPFGQPIIGSTDRRYRERIHAKQGKAFEKGKEAEHEKRVSERVKKRAEYMKTNPAYASKKIESLDTEIRKLDRKLEQEFDPIYGSTQDKFDEWQDGLRLRRQEATEEKEYWQTHLESLGGVKFSKDTINKGDEVFYRGVWKKVVRVNPKGVTVIWQKGFGDFKDTTRKIAYRDIKDKRSEDE